VLGVSIFAGFGVMVALFPVNLIVAGIQSKLEVRTWFSQQQNIYILNV